MVGVLCHDLFRSAGMMQGRHVWHMAEKSAVGVGVQPVGRVYNARPVCAVQSETPQSGRTRSMLGVTNARMKCLDATHRPAARCGHSYSSSHTFSQVTRAYAVQLQSDTFFTAELVLHCCVRQ